MRPPSTAAPHQAATSPQHDHAWRQVRPPDEYSSIRVGSYRCDVCDVTWVP